ncbi:MAG: hypothetical protein WAM81_04950 [Acidimicrobiia bacterium]
MSSLRRDAVTWANVRKQAVSRESVFPAIPVISRLFPTFCGVEHCIAALPQLNQARRK